MYIKDIIYGCTSCEHKTIRFHLIRARDMLYIAFHKNGRSERNYAVSLDKTPEQKKQISAAAIAIVEWFGLSYAEQISVRKDIRRFIAEAN